MTTPALGAVRRHFPTARITLLVKPWVVPVFEHSTDIDQVMVYDANGRHGGRLGLLRLAADLRRQRFDKAILLQNAFEAAFLAFLARIPQRIGFTTDARTMLLTDRINTWKPLKKGHLVDYYLGLLYGIGIKPGDRQLRLTLTEEEKEQARHYLNEKQINGEKLLVGLNPGAAFGTAKRWLPERYAQLGRRLVKERNASVLIFGSSSEAELGEQLAADIGKDCVNLSGKTSLRQAMALIGACHLFITNDSGLMHVAAALDVPQAAVIGPTDPVATGPVNSRSRLVQAAGSCHLSPCLKPHCPIEDHRCMTAISVEMVMDTALSLLEDPRSR